MESLLGPPQSNITFCPDSAAPNYVNRATPHGSLVHDQSPKAVSPAGDRRLASKMGHSRLFWKPEATDMHGGMAKAIICAHSCHALISASLPFSVTLGFARMTQKMLLEVFC
jgi:hypothetical protein